MAVIREQDLSKGRTAWDTWCAAADKLNADCDGRDWLRHSISPDLPRPTWAMAVRYTLFLLERKAPGPGVEVRVAPWGAIKILDGPASDPHNLTPPDVIELEPDVWLRLAAGITTWDEEKEAGHITAVGERDDLSELLPL
ncbi:sterol carrier family protein [Bifidobacterium oedipodis]|uniref:Serine--pyruvate aminotransferase n=1 Tax=Bifidobacterium oedipodis TaxID=2675322 RepID=A0A7Y0HS33_9BIFI|nr:sterol carrier family protein [Bifidobacterium sp. DSM 109957]NMM94740.1 serine--pyruvate aminotransferase [Bifidobacterium sp. DSM 109957]